MVWRTSRRGCARRNRPARRGSRGRGPSDTSDLRAPPRWRAPANPAITGSTSTREALVHQVDRWVDDRLPAGPSSALLHTETLGRLVDRMAVT
ncbi:DUF4254 domain-containing protein [Saccharothrix saharensis]|uniref:DUF4254 domain-containing protein n=1 Tax=Saccharothrix saharensis TaxID=571190 RepID=UPI0036790736